MEEPLAAELDELADAVAAEHPLDFLIGEGVALGSADAGFQHDFAADGGKDALGRDGESIDRTGRHGDGGGDDAGGGD
jgi:hypothetical protein